MKKSLTFLAFIGMLCHFMLSPVMAQKAVKRIVATVQTSAICEQCKDRIEHGLLKIKGVKSAVLDNQTKKVAIKYDPRKVTLAQLKQAIAALGYDADEVKKNEEAFKALPGCCQVKMHD